MVNDEFLADLIPNLAARDPQQILDIAATAVTMAAYKANTKPRLVLDAMWKQMDDARYDDTRRVIDAVVHPTV